MFDFLPSAEVMRLSGAPLRQVIAQVRFGGQSMLGTHEGAAVVHEALADHYPRLLTEQQQVVTMTATGASSELLPQYRLTDLDGAWSIVVGREHLTLETTRYATWTSFRQRFEAALTAVGDITNIRVRERVGLRYINHIEPDDHGLFSQKVQPQLLGPAVDVGWRRHLNTMISQVIAEDGETQLLLRYGLAVDPSNLSAPYLVDVDCAKVQPRTFSLRETLDDFDALNDVSYRCFCWCVPEAYRKQLASAGDN
ncbi:TIGR04255 family protein [Streptosporangium amethystogenes]|uniref:TIGR04255 family protein n=1 Tax=Streptosporangium amethystogenes TaxID=2002 RepID=UPI00379E2791